MVCTIKFAILHYDVWAVPGLAAESDTGIGLAESASVDYHTVHRSVAGYCVNVCSFATFQAHSVIIDIHVAVAYENVIADIKVYCIGAWTFRVAVGRSEDGHIEIFYAVTFI